MNFDAQDEENEGGKKSPYEFDVSDPSKNSKGRGIFRIRSKVAESKTNTTSTSQVNADRATATTSIPDPMIATLGFSIDSTEPETSSVDLPTITVSEDELHDTISDVSEAEASDLEVDPERTSTVGPSVSAIGSCSGLESSSEKNPVGKPPLTGFRSHLPFGSRGMKRVSSNPSISTKSSIKSKVKVLGGKVKEVWGGMTGNRSRSRDDISTQVSKVLKEARDTPSAASSPGFDAVSTSTSIGPEVIVIEVKKLEDIMKRDQELKRKEDELRKLEVLKKKEAEDKKKEEEAKRKLEEKKIKAEEERIRQKQQELSRKDSVLTKKEIDILSKEALLEKRMKEFERRCQELDQQIKQEKEMIDFEKGNLRRQRIFMSGVDLSRDRRSKSPDRSLGQESIETITNQMDKNALTQAAQSQEGLNQVKRPPRTRSSLGSKTDVSVPLPDAKEEVNKEAHRQSWSEYRKKLPPPPRPPLPRPVIPDTTNYSGRVESPSQDLTSITSNTTTSMKTAREELSSPSALFGDSPTSSSTDITKQETDGSRVSDIKSDKDNLRTQTAGDHLQSVSQKNPVSSTSSLFCSECLDIPLDTHASVHPDLKDSFFDPRLFYSKIVSDWKERHPRRILKEGSGKLPPPHPSKKTRLHQQRMVLERKKQQLQTSSTRLYSTPSTRSLAVSGYNEPVSRIQHHCPQEKSWNEPIYAVIQKKPVAGPSLLNYQFQDNFRQPQNDLRSYNYRLQRRKQFLCPMYVEENPYDELIFPIHGFELYPFSDNLSPGPPPTPPPRMNRGRSIRSNLNLNTIVDKGLQQRLRETRSQDRSVLYSSSEKKRSRDEMYPKGISQQQHLMMINSSMSHQRPRQLESLEF